MAGIISNKKVEQMCCVGGVAICPKNVVYVNIIGATFTGSEKKNTCKYACRHTYLLYVLARNMVGFGTCTHTQCCLLITIAEEEEEKIVGSCRPSKSTILLRHLMPTFDISFTRNLMTLLLFSHGDIFFN